MVAKKTPICPHCGGKKVTRVDAFYHCEECKRDFGREALSDSGESMIEAIKGMRFRYGDIISGSARLRFVQDGDDCLYEVYDSFQGGLNKYAGVLSNDEWIAMKKKMFEKIFLNDWDKEYIPVNDGKKVPENNHWEFAMYVNENEEYIFKGVDAYPIYWSQFMKVLHPFFENLKK